MAKKKQEQELSDLLTAIPNEELGLLRELISEYQTKKDWVNYRARVETQLERIKKEYGQEPYDFLRAGLERVIEITKRTHPEYDMCDNKKLCTKSCDGYKFKCDVYIPKYAKNKV